MNGRRGLACAQEKCVIVIFNAGPEPEVFEFLITREGVSRCILEKSFTRLHTQSGLMQTYSNIHVARDNLSPNIPTHIRLEGG